LSIIGYTLWLFTEAVSLLLKIWPVTLALALIAVATRQPGMRELPHPQARSLPSLLFMFPVLILIWGSVTSTDHARATPPIWQFGVLGLIVTLQIAASTALVYVSRSSRWGTGWFAVLLAWVTGVCAYISALAIEGQIVQPA